MILGVTVWAAACGAAILALAILPWGMLLTRGLAPALLRRGERVVLSSLAGYPVAATLYYLLTRAGWPSVFLPLCALAALAAALFARGSTAAAAAPDARSWPHWSLALFVPLALFTMLRFCRAFAPAPGGLAYEHSVDHSLHLSFYWELLRGVPPAQVPVAGGLPFPAYHFLSFMPGLLLVRSAELPVTSAYHVLSPLLKVVLLMGAVYLVVRVRTGDRRAAAAVLPALLCAAYAFESRFNERLVVGPPPHYDFLRNEAEGGGLVVWATIGCLLVLYDRSREQGDAVSARRLLLLASLCAGLSYAFKAQLFLLFGGAYALALLLLLLRGRAGEALPGLLVMAGSFGALFWLSRGAGSLPSVEWQPGLFAELYIYPNLRRDPSPWISQGLLGLFEAFPGGLGYLLAVPLALLRVTAFSPLVVAFLCWAVRRAPRLGLADQVAALAFLLALPMGYGLSIVSFYKATSPFEFRQAAHGLAFLAVLIDVVALFALLRRAGRDAGAWVLGAASLASAAAAPTLLRERPFVPARAGIVLSDDEQCALLFLRRSTPAEALVVSARTGLQRLNHQAVVAGFAGRRALLEVFEKDVDWENDRERDIRRLFSTGDAAVAQRILERYRVDYVLESAALPLSFDKSGLEPAYQRGGYRVYRVRRGAAGPAAPALAEIFRRADELHCPPG